VAAPLDRITRRAHTLSQLLEDGYSIRAADMPGADDLMMRIYAAMAQKERELISERTKAALAAARARGKALGGDRDIGRQWGLTAVLRPRCGTTWLIRPDTGLPWKWRRCANWVSRPCWTLPKPSPSAECQRQEAESRGRTRLWRGCWPGLAPASLASLDPSLMRPFAATISDNWLRPRLDICALAEVS
jgi:hypothetical protein